MIRRVGGGLFLVLIGCCFSGCAPTPRNEARPSLTAASLTNEQAIRSAYHAFVERTRKDGNYYRYYQRPNVLLSESRFAEAGAAYAEAEADVFAELREIMKAAQTVAPALASKWEIAKQLDEGFALRPTDFPRRVAEAEREHGRLCGRYGLPATAMNVKVRVADLTGDGAAEHVVTYTDWPAGNVPNRNAPERPKHRLLRLKIYGVGKDSALLERATFDVGVQEVDKQNPYVSQHWNQDVLMVAGTPVLFHRTYNPTAAVYLFVYDAPEFRPVRLIGGSDNALPETFQQGILGRVGRAQYGQDYKFSDDFLVLKTMRCAYGKQGYADAKTVLREYAWNGTDYDIRREESFDNFLGWKNWDEESGWDGQEW